MKLTDLMIGDYISVAETYCGMNGDYEVYFIDRTITIEDFNFWAENDWNESYFNEFLAPIPLTAEILKKIGFGYIEEDDNITHFYQGEPQFCCNINLHIGTNNKGSFWVTTYQNAIYGIRYVHELQHALRMCGYDDEANKFQSIKI